MSIQKESILKYVLIPIFAVLFLAIYPQLNLWLVKGSAWNGAYVVTNYDEVAYSAYTNSLISGRPRKNDPFIGKDDSPETPMNESLYSIQFIPAYAIAIPAKIFGFSASTSFVVLNFLLAIFSALMIFCLIRAVTQDALFASSGTLVVLLLGTLAAFQGQLQRLIFGTALCDFFPFLRRYQPGIAFPIFFLFCFCVWRSLTDEKKQKGIVFAGFAGIILAVLVFSYFFLWTVAAAWLALTAFIWLIWRKDERKRTLINIFIIALGGIAAIIPYFSMLSSREKNMDEIQLLTYTRMPDLLVFPEIIGILFAFVLFYFIWRGVLKINSSEVLFTLSMLLSPVILFNQQIITGRSLQPVHYEIFSANYMVLVGLMIMLWLIFKNYVSEAKAPIFRKVVIYLGLFAIIWGFVESTAAAKLNAGYENLRDEAMPVLKYLHEQEKTEIVGKQTYPTVISTNLMVADFIPTVTSFRALWNPHTSSAGGVNVAENKELFYKHLYFSGFNEKDLADALTKNVYEVVAAVFGSERALPALGTEQKPLTKDEIQTEIVKYAEYIAKFDREKAAVTELSYIIVPTKAEPDFQHVDQWFERGAGKEFGLFKVYKLKLK